MSYGSNRNEIVPTCSSLTKILYALSLSVRPPRRTIVSLEVEPVGMDHSPSQDFHRMSVCLTVKPGREKLWGGRRRYKIDTRSEVCGHRPASGLDRLRGL